MSGISTLLRSQGATLYNVRRQQKMAIYKPGREHLPRTWLYWYLHHRCPNSRNCLLFKATSSVVICSNSPNWLRQSLKNLQQKEGCVCVYMYTCICVGWIYMKLGQMWIFERSFWRLILRWRPLFLP